jgi:hypothetical protein
MNPSKIFEQAMCAMLRKAELGGGVHLRPWQSLLFDGTWDADADKQFPLVDIRFSPEAVNGDQWTLACTGLLMCATLTDDDRDHAKISGLYEAVYGVAVGIFRSFISGVGDYYSDFLAEVATAGAGVVNVGGITLESPMAPDNSEGTNTIGIGITVHFSYV